LLLTARDTDVRTFAVPNVTSTAAAAATTATMAAPPTNTSTAAALSPATVDAPSGPALLRTPFDATLSPAPFDVALSPASVAAIGTCPCCGCEGKLKKRIGQGVMAVLISANRDFYAHLEAAGVKFENGGSTIMTCQAWKILGSAALMAAKLKYPQITEFTYSSSIRAVAMDIKKQLICEMASMVCYFHFLSQF